MWSGDTTYIYIEKMNTLTLFRKLYPRLGNPKECVFTHFQKKGQGPLPVGPHPGLELNLRL